MEHTIRLALLAGSGLTLAMGLGMKPAQADQTASYLSGIHHHTTIASSVPGNGDQNPYAMAFAPTTVGKIQKGDLLVDNFNNKANLQGLGTTIVDYRPATGQTSVFAALPATLPGCPGGVGLSTAMAVLKSGWVIVGSAPSTDGTTKTLGKGCLIVLDAEGKVQSTITDPNINDPWGNMAWIDNGDSATLFVSNAGFGIGAPGQAVQNTATVLRINMDIPPGQPPRVVNETVIGNGFGAQADASVFLIGPTGLALGKDGTLYVSDAIGNRIASISNAVTRTDSAGTGQDVTKNGFLQRPLAMDWAPNGNLLVANGLNGQVVEINPQTGKQIAAQWIDADEAQTPPGSGDLFGIVATPNNDGFYYVEDDMNTIVHAQ